MATGQSILNLMEVLHPELQLQTGEGDVTKALLTLNAAQDYMESVFAVQPGLMGDSKGTVTTAISTETTAFPTSVLRLDALYFIDPTTSQPTWKLDDIRTTGGHAGLIRQLPYVSSSAPSGAPSAYYTDGRFIYWAPLPDAVYTVRWYGFQAQADITATGTFLYPDVCMMPLAIMAVRMFRTGLDDDTAPYTKLAEDVFEPVVSLLANFQRERAPGFMYRYTHDT